jgi:GntR family transcriptional regulator/MocR family aminotransferase
VPSSRALASNLGISRATVTQSYEQLISEGYLETAIGSGTMVSAQLPDDTLHTAPAKRVATQAQRPASLPKLSQAGQRMLTMQREQEAPLPYNFKYCRPAVDEFPLAQWRRLLARQYRAENLTALDYAEDGCGEPSLRAAVAGYLTRARAVQCEAEQVVIVNGSQQALSLISQVLLDRGDVAALEEPGYLGARQAFQAYGARLHPVAVDEAGIIPEALPTKGARLLYVTPSHQFPTGAVLSLARRLELLQWAQATNTWLIEDDYDSEFRYGGQPVPALQGLATHDQVLYVGTFSKVMFPALRIGYLVVPRALVKVFEQAKWLQDRHKPAVEQRALAEFISDGSFERHLRRMRKLYDGRQQALVKALQTHFGDRVEILGANSGMHLMIRLSSRLKEREVIARAAEVGVGIIGASIYYVGAAPQHEFVLGYAPLSERKILEGIKRLARVLA